MDLDKELAAVYKEARSKAGKEDQLRAIQRGWIKGRNECWKEENKEAYMADLYQQRINELREKYQLAGKDAEPSPANSSTKGFDKVLKLEGITFHVRTTNDGSLNQVTIETSGLSISNPVLKNEVDGSVISAEVADLNHDGSPEIYIFANSAGSGSYGSVIAYSSNHNKSITPIYMPELDLRSKEAKGYMGHDEYTIMEGKLVRRFPIYKKDDPNCCPTGGMRQLYYDLVPGEASWQLKLVESEEQK
jgi:uncharacterized protein